MATGLPAHIDEADLISYGLGGLIAAIERFDMSREIRFETYAKLEAQLQRSPTEEELAAELELPLEDFRDALLQIANSSVSALDELWTSSDSGGDSISLLDTLKDPAAVDPERVVDQNELRDRIAEAVDRLPEREKLVIALYYYENLTLREIGEVLRVTESRVSQLHTKAVLGLRASLSQIR